MLRRRARDLPWIRRYRCGRTPEPCVRGLLVDDGVRHGRGCTATDPDRRDGNRVTTIVRDQLLQAACEATGFDDFGDVPFLDPLDVLIDSLERDAHVDGRSVGIAPSRCSPGCSSSASASSTTARSTPRSPTKSSTRRSSSSASPVRGRRTCTRCWRASTACGRRSSGRCRCLRRRPTRATFDTDPRIATVQAMVDQMPAEMLVRHPMSATRPSSATLLNDWSFINQAWMASFDIPSYRDWFLDADYAPAYEAHRRTLQHLQWQQPRPVGAQVPEAPAVARRAARRLPRRGADLDASRPRHGRAVRGEPHRLHAPVNTPSSTPCASGASGSSSRSSRCTAGSRHATATLRQAAPPRPRLPRR